MKEWEPYSQIDEYNIFNKLAYYNRDPNFKNKYMSAEEFFNIDFSFGKNIIIYMRDGLFIDGWVDE